MEMTIDFFPKKCENNSQCLGKNNGNLTLGETACVCYPNKNGYKWCSGFIGDYVEDINYFDELTA